MKIRVPAYFTFIVKVFGFNIFLFLLCRLVLYNISVRKWPLSDGTQTLEVFRAFLIGIQFDTVVLSYILFIPFITLGIIDLFHLKHKSIFTTVKIFLLFSLSLTLFILFANIPYFLHYFSPLSSSAFLWIDNPGYSLQMVLQEKTFLIYIIPLALFITIEVLFISKQFKKVRTPDNTAENLNSNKKIYNSAFILFGCLILFAGIRGRISGKAPIQVGSAFFSDNALLNNMGINPVFTLIHSSILDLNPVNAKINLMPSEEALKLAGNFLTSTKDENNSAFPLARTIIPTGEMDKMNVVIVIMEAMSKFKMGKWGGPQNLTPGLNQLKNNSYYFDKTYTAGIHTFNGIYSTLFSYPALYKQHPMKLLMQVPHDGLANILRKEGYQTTFFTTHDPDFDNVRGFLMANGFDRVYSEMDYPSEWIQSTNGVPDHKLFEFAVPQLDKMASKEKPFLAAFMTTSDHGPYIIPDGISFSPKSVELTDQIVEYADWSISQFMEACRTKPWFSNTMFVFIADHGLSLGHTYDMPLAFHESPLIYYAPEKLKEAKTFHSPAGQIDVAPTLLGLLNIPYVNNTLGIDLLKEERPFIYFCADDRIGCIDDKHFLILRKNGMETLYEYANLETKNLISEFPEKVDSMKIYCFSMMQSYQWMIDNQKLKLSVNKIESSLQK
ncbi:MAG: alkaline phosphatase family protein [Bacteroidetes bacterium]|nr:MAG: alkaline phosphatase family protein [Bacteroidota bacterium]